MPKLFKELSHRYASRNGGYTRVHRYGYRKGDHAPSAILELVDSPNDLRFSMAAKIAGRELAALARKDAEAEKAIKRWLVQSGLKASQQQQEQTSEEPVASTSRASETQQTSTLQDLGLGEIYTLLSPRTQSSIVKALRFRQASPLPEAASAPSSSSPLPAFEALVRESYFRTSVLAKVPAWETDPDKLAALQASQEQGTPLRKRASTSALPLTLPGRGRKLWAGQEGSNPHERLLPAFEKLQVAEDVSAEEHDAAMAQAVAETEAEAEQAEAQRLQAALLGHGENLQSKKARHPDGRNGRRYKPVKEVHSRPSALGRAKGQLAPAKGLSEFKVTGRAELPRPGRSHQQYKQHRASL